jgi:ribosome-associated protein
VSDEFETVFEHSTHNRADGPSKSQKKRDAKAVQDLGVEIMEQKPEFIRNLDLPNELAQALLDGQNMERGARKRQIKFIGRLLRDIDVAPLQAALASLQEESAEDVRSFHRVEAWRDRLLDEGEDAVAALVAEAPDLDLGELRRLLRTAAAAAGEGRKKASRALFRFLRGQLHD